MGILSAKRFLYGQRGCSQGISRSPGVFVLSVARHADALYIVYAAAPDGRDWTYMFVGPFRDKDEYHAYLTTVEQQQDTQCYVVIDTRTDNAVGTFSWMRVDVNNGVIEVGSVAFSSALKRTPLETEAHFLLMGYVFEQLLYRRYEWKCDSLNAPSRRAALRLGFTFEGIFRQAAIYKGRTRDTAWFSRLDTEWPQRKLDFLDWLAQVTSILKENRSNHSPRSGRLG